MNIDVSKLQPGDRVTITTVYTIKYVDTSDSSFRPENPGCGWVYPNDTENGAVIKVEREHSWADITEEVRTDG